MPIGLGAGTAIAGAIGGGSAIAGGVLANRANNRAAQLGQQGIEAQLAFAREQAAADERRYREQTAREQAQWEARQAQAAPYRAASLSVLNRQMGIRPQQPPPGPVARPPAPIAGGGLAALATGTAAPMARPQRLSLADLLAARGGR